MINYIKDKIIIFFNNSKDYPFLVGFFSGFYPLVFFYSNNYESINSLKHFIFFVFLFLLLPSIVAFVLYKVFSNFKNTKPFKKHLLFVFIIEVTAIFMSQVYYITIKKKMLLLLFIFIVLLSIKIYDSYKKVVFFIMLLSILPFLKCLYIFGYKQINDTQKWMIQEDKILSVKFLKKPNVYFLEPDGYAGKESMIDLPYNYKDTIYDWLEYNSFTLYKNTRSNYPASLASNASMFAMKHHYLENIPSSPFEMQDSRAIIVGDNPVVTIFKNNNYQTFFIVEDGYFQQSFKKGHYDFYNIQDSEIPFFSNDNNAKKDVYIDLKIFLENAIPSDQSKFFFIEKLLPHHIHFDGTGVENERKEYLRKIEITNLWLKKTIDLINKNDPNAMIIISSDHGGWVGIEDIKEMFSTHDIKKLKSIFGNLLAIKWNNSSHTEYDKDLKTNVNIFRILFSYLSENKKLLEQLEDDSSYIIRQDGMFSRKAVLVDF